MERARRHHRALAAAAFGLLALVAELAGRSLTHRINVGRHVESPSYSGADYYPLLMAFVKVGIALLYGAVARWLGEYERYAAAAAEHARRAVAARREPLPRPATVALAPRRLFGLAFESRPPPLPA